MIRASLTEDRAAGVFCTCPQCRGWDPISQTLVPGRYIGENERKLHVRADRGAAIAASHIRLRPQAPVAPNSPGPSHARASTKPSSPSNAKSLELSLPDSVIQRLRTTDAELDRFTLSDVRAADAFLIFCNPPTRHSPPMKAPDNIALSLQEGLPFNKLLLEKERWLKSTHQFLQDLRLIVLQQPRYYVDLQELAKRIDRQKELLALFKMSHWETQRIELCQISENVRISNTNRYMTSTLASYHPVAIACYVLIALMNLICGTSLRTCRLLIAALRVVVKNSSDQSVRSKLIVIPNDPRSIISFLDLDPSVKRFVCCPKCFEIYPFDPTTPDDFPAFCSFKSTDKSEPCSEALRKKASKTGRSSGPNPHTVQEEPIRLYLYHELSDWVSRLYSRPDIEVHLDNSLLERPGDGKVCWDILDAPELRNFKGPESDTKGPFLRPHGKEGRLVFSLNMDGFNPFTNKESGKKVTTCAMYMICLNLPPAIRYDIENVFLVGIIPGPYEPSKEQINPLLRPLVDDLLVMWYHGFYLTSTHKYPNGRLVRGAVVPLICDLPAARQMSGFADHSSKNFCSVCKLQADDKTNFDYKSWSLKDDKEHRRLATLWKDAPSETRQAELYELYGVRWSELLRLPYWDAPRYTVIDSMHAFLLRMLQRHVRQIMGMSVDFDDGDGPSMELLDKDKPIHSVMVESRKTLRTGSEEQLKKLKLNALRELCYAAGLHYSGVKKKLIQQLIDYRFEKGWFDDNGNVIGDENDALPEPEKSKATAVYEASLKRLQSSREKLSDDTKDNSSSDTKDKSTDDNRDNSSDAEEKLIVDTKKKRKPKRPVDDPPTQEELERGLDLLEHGLKRKLLTLRKALLKYLCDKNSISYPVGCKGPELVDRLENWRFENGIVDAKGQPMKVMSQAPENKKGTKVLGRETLAEIRTDMGCIILPSWVARAPSQPGTQRQGKLTADQWRSFCLINLTFTLTRLWGPEPKDSRKRRMLDNFLHLVTAVKIASMRSMTPERISDYTFHMNKYLTTLLDLYPGATISPYQHMALHFQAFLERFGPTHAWRCFPFERFNYLLQNIPTNLKFGDLEVTMFRKFCMGQTLRHMFRSSKLPSELHDLILTWEKEYRADIRGTLRGDAFTFNESFNQREETETWKPSQLKALPEDWYLALQSWLRLRVPDCDVSQLNRCAFLRNSISRLGETYRTQATSASEGNIYYREADESWSAGLVQGIFSHTRSSSSGRPRTQTFFIVNQYRPLPEDKAHLDHFHSFPVAAGRIYQDVFFQGPAIISAEEVLCHFGRGNLELPEIDSYSCFVALPLDRS